MSIDFSEVQRKARGRTPEPDAVDEFGNATEVPAESKGPAMSEADAKALLERCGMKDAEKGAGLYATLTRNETAYDGFRDIFRMMSGGPFPMPEDHLAQIKAALSKAEADLDAARKAFADYLGLACDADTSADQMMEKLAERK